MLEALSSVAEAMEVENEEVRFFVDAAGLVDAFDAPSDVRTTLAPLGPMAAAYQFDDEQTLGVFVWLIDYVDSEG